ncbi:DUF6716 putative glycosyltransferase [Streptomyces sp. B6B3]|uniref:DUF6716 putative glycosyltransferase n=1 Tax=Streptomyces sp. B6B3 TaxID=3153570 RepID=UPI00325D5B58
MPSVSTVPDPSPTSLRVAVLADSDTRWKWGALTARRLAPGSAVHGYLLRGRATPTARQLAETGVQADELREIDAVDFLAELGDRAHSSDAQDRALGDRADAGGAREPYDVLVLSCVGGTIQAMLHGLTRAWESADRRPVVVTGYVGVVYEKLADGLLLRHGADLILANSPHDAKRFRAVYDGVRADSSAVTECVLPFLGGRGYDPDAVARGERPYRVVFAVQPSVPDGRKERAYLLGRAIEHARRHPEREVVLKLRSRPGEHTTHVEELPYQRLADRLKDEQPPNFRLAYGNMGEVLDGTDLLVTVSSTAALESLQRGIPTVVLSDLGIREPLGNHYFIGSGCFASWDELDDGHLPEPSPEWLADQGITPAAPLPEDHLDEQPSDEHLSTEHLSTERLSTEALSEEKISEEELSDSANFNIARGRLVELLGQARQAGLPPLAPYYTARTAPEYLPRILARHGLDAKGDPIGAPRADAGPGSGLRRASRTLLRRTARGAYRAGVQRVAPIIRRWGQL